MKRLILILLALFAMAPALVSARSLAQAGRTDDPVAEGQSMAAEEPSVDVSEVIFGHVGDSYEWHITKWGDRDIAISLPVIVRTHEGRWLCFSSGHLIECPEYEGLHIAAPGESHEGKIVEADGRRPFDISITKNVLSLMMSALLLIILVMLTARWYRRHDSLHEAPKGLAALMEPLVVMVHGMAKDNIGEDYLRYSPFLLTAFLFILLNNFMGIIPFFPGGANLTGNIACTVVLALFTFFTVNLTGSRHYYKEIVNPDVPGLLKPLMALIESFSALVKPVSLSIRLFANMLAGHIQILCMVCIIFIMAKYGGVLLGGMSVISVLFGIFLDALEMLISFIQAYIFTMLSSIYIGLARVKH
ncbi:MAG: F0F1 ATP synthase subunit A [Bacteroidales bacterium]|nr:F0F1 ATP synthase subunit A [Bacteroidales bacterium]